MTMANRYQIQYPRVPGAKPAVHRTANTLSMARLIARATIDRRRDLTYQDVRIDDARTGRRVEFAGPSR
jgi:hypothetical protein